MFSGAQISLYPMSDDYVGIILAALTALDPYLAQCRIETDHLSTLEADYAGRGRGGSRITEGPDSRCQREPESALGS